MKSKIAVEEREGRDRNPRTSAYVCCGGVGSVEDFVDRVVRAY